MHPPLNIEAGVYRKGGCPLRFIVPKFLFYFSEIHRPHRGPQENMQIDGVCVPSVRSGPTLGKFWAKIWLTSTFDLRLLGLWGSWISLTVLPEGALHVCEPHLVWPLRSECCGRGVPMKVVCTECMKMCCLGGKNSVVKRCGQLQYSITTRSVSYVHFKMLLANCCDSNLYEVSLFLRRFFIGVEALVLLSSLSRV